MFYNNILLRKHIEEICILIANPDDENGIEALKYFKELYDATEGSMPGFASHCASNVLGTFASNKETSLGMLKKVASFRISALTHKVLKTLSIE